MNMRLLLIEDQPSAVELTHRLLNGFVSRFDDANSLAEGLWMARHNTYDVVILDLRLADSDRNETIEAIPEVKAAAQAPVVVMTGWPEPGIKERCLKAGADAFVNKDEITTAILMAVQIAVQKAAPKERTNTFSEHFSKLHQRLLKTA